MCVEEYSQLAFLNKLTEDLRNAVLRFVHSGTSCPLLDKALMSSPDLRNHIDLMLDQELKKYGKD